MNILVKCPERSKLKQYLINYSSVVVILTIMNSFFFKWYIVISAMVILSLFFPYLKLISTRMIYQIELDDENKTMTLYYYVIYKNKKKTIAFNDLKFELKSTAGLVSKKVKYDLIFLKKKWIFGSISNHDRGKLQWSDQDIQFLMRYYYTEIKKLKLKDMER